MPAVIYNPACLFHLFQSPNTSWLEALNMFHTSEGAGIMTVFSIYFIWKLILLSLALEKVSLTQSLQLIILAMSLSVLCIFLGNNNHITWVLSVKKNPYIATLLLSSIINIVRQVSLPQHTLWTANILSPVLKGFNGDWIGLIEVLALERFQSTSLSTVGKEYLFFSRLLLYF